MNAVVTATSSVKKKTVQEIHTADHYGSEVSAEPVPQTAVRSVCADHK